jgi:Protein of unknown function (DUF3500)
MADEAAALFRAVRSLSASQKAKAELSQSFDDVLVGPQKEGDFPARQGVTVSKLSKKRQQLVTKAIRTYVGDMPAKEANKLIAAYKKQYSKTKLAWSGSTDGTTRRSPRSATRRADSPACSRHSPTSRSLRPSSASPTTTYSSARATTARSRTSRRACSSPTSHRRDRTR